MPPTLRNYNCGSNLPLLLFRRKLHQGDYLIAARFRDCIKDVLDDHLLLLTLLLVHLGRCLAVVALASSGLVKIRIEVLILLCE